MYNILYVYNASWCWALNKMEWPIIYFSSHASCGHTWGLECTHYALHALYCALVFHGRFKNCDTFVFVLRHTSLQKDVLQFFLPVFDLWFHYAYHIFSNSQLFRLYNLQVATQICDPAPLNEALWGVKFRFTIDFIHVLMQKKKITLQRFYQVTAWWTSICMTAFKTTLQNNLSIHQEAGVPYHTFSSMCWDQVFHITHFLPCVGI